jgi:hypothetical protein
MSDRPVAVRLFLTCWLVFSLHFATNTVREIFPALVLGDHLSFDVSEYAGLHPDIFVIEDRGAFINNNPGASLLAAVPYVLTRPLIDSAVARVQRARQASDAPVQDYDTVYPMAREFLRESRARGLDVKFALAAGVVQALLMAPLSALAAVVMFRLLGALGVSRRASLGLALLFAFATPVFYRTAQLNHNLLVCHAGLFAFALLFRADADPHERALRFLGAGLLGGYAVVLDYSGVVTASAVALYGLAVWSGSPGRRPNELGALLLGLAASGAVLLGYQWLCFGNPLWPAQHYMPETDHSGAGYRGMGLPDLELLGLIAFGPRYGIFTSAPLLLLALWAPGWQRERGGLLARRELRFVLLFCAGMFLFTSANQFARMQFNSGVRHMVPVTPFLFLLAAGPLLRIPRGLAIAVAGVTTFWAWCLAMARDVEQSLGLLDPLLTVLREGPVLPWLTTLQRMGYAPPGPWAVIPLLAAGAVLAWLWWTLPAGALEDQGAGVSR